MLARDVGLASGFVLVVSDVGLGRLCGVVRLLGVVLVLDQQAQRFGGLGQDSDGAGPSGPDWIGVAFSREDVSDPVDCGEEPDGVTGCGFARLVLRR